MTLRCICVYAGSSPGHRPEYIAAARELGEAMARRRIDLVYGGAHVGLMGAIADTVLAHGGKVFGVIPEALRAKELAHTGLTELHVVPTMHERKKLMSDLADAFIALPGGWGTLEEYFEALTWSQLRIHMKPCGLLNVAHYYDPLLRFLDHTIVEGFVREYQAGMVLAASSPDRLLDVLAQYVPPSGEKWPAPTP